MIAPDSAGARRGLAVPKNGSTVKLLHDVLPIDAKHSAVSVRNHVLRAAQRTEAALGVAPTPDRGDGQVDREQLPIPDGPLAVGLDGGSVRARRGATGEQSSSLFEVIAGKSILAFRRDDPEDVPPSSKCFALVRSVDPAPKRRLAALLHAQGLQAGQQVTIFSDGGDTVRALPAALLPEAEHILDWFHVTMRITVLQQCARGLLKAKALASDRRTLDQRVESVKHYLWHGNTGSALEGLADLGEDLESWEYDEEGEPQPRSDSDGAARMRKYVRELATYIRNNASSIVNYGERYRNGERISTGFVESAVNQVVSKRLVKKQQMQWTPDGAHLLLQVRTSVLNNEWEATFRTWYPRFRPAQTEVVVTPVAA